MSRLRIRKLSLRNLHSKCSNSNNKWSLANLSKKRILNLRKNYKLSSTSLKFKSCPVTKLWCRSLIWKLLKSTSSLIQKGCSIRSNCCLKERARSSTSLTTTAFGRDQIRLGRAAGEVACLAQNQYRAGFFKSNSIPILLKREKDGILNMETIFIVQKSKKLNHTLIRLSIRKIEKKLLGFTWTCHKLNLKGPFLIDLCQKVTLAIYKNPQKFWKTQNLPLKSFLRKMFRKN